MRPHDDDDLEAEARAFDQRIDERIANGFIPDLRRARPCPYFYKSFWRDPLFIRHFVGWSVDRYLELLETHCGRELRILDVGCGPGYVALELARNGHHVTGVDISARNIAAAEAAAAENPHLEGFGSLAYRTAPFLEVEGIWDVVLFSVSLHHMPDVEGAAEHARRLLRPGGWLLTWEPCHERFTESDASTVALIRALLSATGHWHDPAETAGRVGNERDMAGYVHDVWREYVEERDPSEAGGQSPNDLSADGAAILGALRARFDEVAFFPGYSFIYRLLGGIRGDDETIRRLADLITVFDRLSVARYGQNPNHFFFLGRLNDGGGGR